MSRSRLNYLLSLLLVAFPGFVAAQESVRTPNDDAACFGNADKRNVAAIAAGRRMNIRAISGQVPALRTDDQGSVTLANCQTGPSVANLSTIKLCSDAQSAAKGYACTGQWDDGFCGPGQIHPDCCDPTIDFINLGVNIICNIPGKGGIRLQRVAGGDQVVVSATVPNTLNAVNTTTNGGNTISSDPLPQHLEGLVTNGVNGVVAWQIFHTQGGSNPRTFTVDTTGKNDTQIATAIAAGFNSSGLGLAATVHPSPDAPQYSHFPQAFFVDDFVVVPDTVSHGVLEIRVNTIEGQQITIEDNVPGGQVVPTLSTVGMVLLVALLMAGAWYLQRRQRLQQA